MRTADMLLINGRFITMEPDTEYAEAVAVESGKILFVGTTADAMKLAGADTEVIDLQGKVAAPGLIDCHTHPMGSFALRFACLNLRGENTSSLSNLLDCIRNAAKNTPKGEWIVGRGFDESKFTDCTCKLTAEILDQATTDHPVFLSRTCGHIAVLNSAAIQFCGFTDDSQDPDTGGHFFKDENGHLTGMISGSIFNKVPVPAITDGVRENCMMKAQEEYFRKGITASGEMGSRPVTLRALQRLDRTGKLKLRIGFYHVGRRNPDSEPMAQKLSDVGLLPGFGSERLQVLGIKFVMDGSTGGRTAAFSVPYQNEPDNYGELYNDQDQLNEDVLNSALAGIQISIHAIGDRAIEGALRAVEYAKANGANTDDLRIRFEHLESPTPEQIERIKKLNICVGLSSAFIYSLGDSHLSALGYDRLVDAFPAKTLMEKGIVIGCNSDCPVCDVNPMLGIYSMVTRTTEAGQSFGGNQESVDRLQALRSYTKDAAYILYRDNMLGTLKPGKFADIVVFEQDYLNVPDEQLKDVQIFMTISNGEIVYKKA